MNTTTLNMTTLDGGVIIKKGTAPAPPSGGGGADLEGEYLLVRPNGWYWKVTDTFINLGIESQYQAITSLFVMFGTLYEVGSASSISGYVGSIELKLCYRDVGILQYISTQKLVDYVNPIDSWIVIAEGGKTKMDIGDIVGEFESIYEALCALAMPMTETEFEAMMLAQYGLQRITKEEYEALITE